MDEISGDARLNTQILHLEGEKVFGSAKQKLDLPPRDDGNSHRHHRVNFSVSKSMKRASPSQCRTALTSPIVFAIEDLAMPTPLCISQPGPIQSKNGFSIVELPCTNLMDWRIERISSSSHK